MSRRKFGGLLAALAILTNDLTPAVQSKIDRDPAIGTSAVIEVHSLGDQVHLGGIVESWGEHYAATQDAFLAGAHSVVNEIHVRDAPQASNRTFFYTKTPA
jgi:hypothetical protein